MFKREEQNFVLGNEIDNMALIMPSQSKSSSSSTANAMPPPPTDGKRAGRKREKKRLEPHNSLNVACLKRLLPIGLSFFQRPRAGVTPASQTEAYRGIGSRY